MVKKSNLRGLDLSFFRAQQLMEVDACTGCSLCVPVCPVKEVSDENNLTPLEKIRQIREVIAKEYGIRAKLFPNGAAQGDSISRLSEATYSCLLCNRCAEVCPAQIDTRDLWVAVREAAVGAGVSPKVLATMYKTIEEFGNITGDDPRMRLGWREALAEQGESPPEEIDFRLGSRVVYLVGCLSSLYPTVYGIPQSAVKIFEAAGVDVTTLGDKELCCGFPLIIAGMGKKVKAAVEANVRTLRVMNPALVVIACPSCFHTWTRVYPEIIGEELGFKIVHSTEFVNKLLREGYLKPKSWNAIITYHDPCDLGRNSGIYEAPRQILTAIPGLELVEMQENRRMALCCGGGGNMDMTAKDLGSLVALRRLEMALETGAEVIASSCQQCKRKLTITAKTSKIRMKTLDVLEVLAGCL